MRKLYVLAFALAVIAGCVSTPVSSGAQAKSGSGQWLHDMWRGYQETDRNGAAAAWPAHVDTRGYQSFIIGAAAVMYDADWLDLAGVTYGQEFAVVGKYLDEHPEQWNLSAERLVYLALYAAWPGKVAAPYQ